MVICAPRERGCLGRARSQGGGGARCPRGVRPDQARLAPVGIRVSQGDAASAFANCGLTVAYVGGR